MRSFGEKAYKPSEAKDKHTQYDNKPTWIDTHKKCTCVLLEKHLLQFSVKKFYKNMPPSGTNYKKVSSSCKKSVQIIYTDGLSSHDFKWTSLHVIELTLSF